MGRQLPERRRGLLAQGSGTLVSYNVERRSATLNCLGQRLINSVAKKTADDFFGNFAAAVRPKVG